MLPWYPTKSLTNIYPGDTVILTLQRRHQRGCNIGHLLWSFRLGPIVYRIHLARGGMKPVRTPLAILGSLGVCIYVPASRHWLISYSPIDLT